MNNLKFPSITVCIPSKLENINFILELLNSISKQTLLPQKTLVVASGRPVNELNQTINFIRSKIPSLLNTEFIVSQKKGLGMARNIGIENCKTEILIFGDDDDLWDKRRIEIIVKTIVFSGSCLVRHLHGEIIGNKKRKVSERYALPTNHFFVGTGNLIGGGSNFAGNIEIFKSLKFDTSLPFCEDWEFWIRVILSRIKIVTIYKVLVNYRVHEGRMTSSLYKNYKYETFVRFKYIKASLLFCIGSIIGFLKSTSKILITIFMNFILSLLRIIKN